MNILFKKIAANMMVVMAMIMMAALVVPITASATAIVIESHEVGDMKWSMSAKFITAVQNRDELQSHTVVQEYQTETLCNAALDRYAALIALPNQAFRSDPATGFVGDTINKGTTMFGMCNRIRE